MRLPNSLYNWGRILLTAVVGGIVMSMLHYRPTRLYIIGAAVLALFVLLIELIRSAFSGKDPFYWWRK